MFCSKKEYTHTTLINSDPHSDMILHYTKHMSDQVSNLGSPSTDDPVIFSLEDEARVDQLKLTRILSHTFNPDIQDYLNPFKRPNQFLRKEP